MHSTIESAMEEAGYSLEPKYSDFAHQQILSATLMLDENHAYADKMIGNILAAEKIGDPLENLANGTEFAREYRTSFAGWLGDIRLADSKISGDDYKSDLDGANISNLVINEEMNTIEAMNKYYETINSEESTREKEFLLNMGDGDIQRGMETIQNLDQIPSGWQNFKNIPGIIRSFFTGEEAPEVIGDQIFSDFIDKVAAGLE